MILEEHSILVGSSRRPLRHGSCPKQPPPPPPPDQKYDMIQFMKISQELSKLSEKLLKKCPKQPPPPPPDQKYDMIQFIKRIFKFVPNSHHHYRSGTTKRSQ